MLECNRFLEMDEEQIGIAGEMRGRLHGRDRHDHSRDKKLYMNIRKVYNHIKHYKQF